MSLQNNDIEEWLLSLTPESGLGKAFVDYYNNESKKNRILNISVAKKMISTFERVKEYFNDSNCKNFKIEVNPFDDTRCIGVITIVFEELNLSNGNDFKELVQGSSYVELIIDGVNPRIDIGFRNITDELK